MISEKEISICVIGSGASGLPSIKSCLEQGFQVVCFERLTKSEGFGDIETKELMASQKFKSQL
jgi:3-hydroxyisobutyrate dehydrogenase-like beta-hydroxyacid dehydrogenase